MRILLAEDDPSIILMLEAVLKPYGHDLTIAIDGEQAKEIFKHMQPPDLVITDLNMPYSSGLQLSKYLRKDMGWKGKTIMFTGSLVGPIIWKAAGIDVVIKKDDVFGLLREVDKTWLEN